MDTEKKNYVYGWEEIKRFLPHRYPFLFIDRVMSVDRSEAADPSSIVNVKIHTMKCVTGNEEVFQGHFPNYAVVPGVLLIEMMAQSSIFVLPVEELEQQKKQVFLSKVSECRFRSQARPGDVLDIYCHVTAEKNKFYTFDTTIEERSDKRLVCEATLMAYFDS